MKRKRLGFAIGLAAVCAAASLLLLWLVRDNASDSIEARYLAGDLSGTIAALAAEQDKHEGGLSRDEKHDRARAHFLVANCYRLLGMNRNFEEEIDRMRSLPEAADLMNLATAMFKIQHGELNDSPSALVDLLQSAGALETDAWSVVIRGMFAADRLDEAQQLLEQWRTQFTRPAQGSPAELEYLAAIGLNIGGKADQAEARLIATLEQHPQHELSWLALAELYSRPPNVRLPHSERVLEHLTARFPHNPDADVRLARVRRRLAKAKQSLGQLASADTEIEHLEKANVEFDVGNYRQSVATLKRVGLSTADDFRRLTDAAFELSLRGQGDAADELTQRVTWGATALALNGDRATARTMFSDAADRTARLRRLQDLNNQQAAGPARRAIAEEMSQLVALATPFGNKPLERFAPAEKPVAHDRGLELYQTHCAHCHGKSGRGDGRAGGNLFPAPRNFRDEPIRLVSSQNRVAGDEDIARIIRGGEPGTSMPAFDELSDAEVSSLVAVVRQFMVDGLRARYARELAADVKPNEAQAAQWLAARAEPSAPLMLPELASTPQQVARGAELFRTAGCANCHASSGEPPLAHTRLFDSLGRPVKAPRLDVDPFHGGDDAAQIYKRIVLGIPGTPHPALVSADASEAESLVAYIRSIRSAAPAVISNYQRAQLVVQHNGVAPE